MTTDTQPQSISVDEASERYPNEWIFMRVTADDEYHAPSHGVVLTHHPKRGIIQRAVMRAIAVRTGEEQYYLFFGQQPIRTREEWIAVIERQVRNGS